LNLFQFLEKKKNRFHLVQFLDSKITFYFTYSYLKKKKSQLHHDISDRGKKELELDQGNQGWIGEAIKLVKNAEFDINKILFQNQNDSSLKFFVNEFKFSSNKGLHYDLEDLFENLNDNNEDTAMEKNSIKLQIEMYLNKKFIPKLLELDLLIAMNAFFVDGEPIFDIFHEKNAEERVMRTGKQLSYIFGGQLMTLFYKMIYLVHIANDKDHIDLKNAVDIFLILQNDDQDNIPKIDTFNEKVRDDVAVTNIIVYYTNTIIFLILNFI